VEQQDAGTALAGSKVRRLKSDAVGRRQVNDARSGRWLRSAGQSKYERNEEITGTDGRRVMESSMSLRILDHWHGEDCKRRG
jgi:hypothetical protein